jgi:hypothetical protein
MVYLRQIITLSPFMNHHNLHHIRFMDEIMETWKDERILGRHMCKWLDNIVTYLHYAGTPSPG